MSDVASNAGLEIFQKIVDLVEAVDASTEDGIQLRSQVMMACVGAAVTAMRSVIVDDDGNAAVVKFVSGALDAAFPGNHARSSDVVTGDE